MNPLTHQNNRPLFVGYFLWVNAYICLYILLGPFISPFSIVPSEGICEIRAYYDN